MAEGNRTTGTIATVLMTVALGAVGIGLTMPVLPSLVRDVAGRSDLGWRFGAFIGLYALMQFLCAPVLGAISDRIGRKPVLLLSLVGALADYLVMAFAPTLTLLFIGRAIAGLTGANLAVASAVIADITPEDQRTKRFGQINACFGLGFIAGPVIGGLLGGVSVRAPFVAAAVLNGLTLLIALVALHETRPTPEVTSGTTLPPSSIPSAADFNPFQALRWIAGFPALVPLVVATAVLGLVGEVGGTIWVFYGEDKFAWDSFTIGLSLAAFGIFHAGSQAFLVGPVSARWGTRTTFLVGILADSTGYVLIAFATRGWMAFVLVPLLCLGGLGAPALQSAISAQMDDQHQGRLQGVLSSMTSLASIIGPVAISLIYFATRDVFPGAVWIGGALLYLFCIPALSRMKPHQP